MPTRRAAPATPAAAKKTSTAKPAARTAAKPAAKPAARTAAAKPAATRRAAPARASRKPAAAPVDEEPDLLADMDDAAQGGPAEDDGDAYDLLSDMTEENGTAWMPWDEADQPEGIQGAVKYIGEVDRDKKYGGGLAPYVEVQDREDPDMLWGVRGYATVLANQLQKAIDAGMQVGDFIAIKYFGEVMNKAGDNEYKNFKVVTKAARR